MSKLSFVVFCVENYADYKGLPSEKVYELFKRENLLDMLESDYGDLHGMGKEFLMQFFDKYLGSKK